MRAGLVLDEVVHAVPGRLGGDEGQAGGEGRGGVVGAAAHLRTGRAALAREGAVEDDEPRVIAVDAERGEVRVPVAVEVAGDGRVFDVGVRRVGEAEAGGGGGVRAAPVDGGERAGHDVGGAVPVEIGDGGNARRGAADRLPLPVQPEVLLREVRGTGAAPVPHGDPPRVDPGPLVPVRLQDDIPPPVPVDIGLPLRLSGLRAARAPVDGPGDPVIGGGGADGAEHDNTGESESDPGTFHASTST
ncbi:hypothetical protein GA0115246_102768 [Streptomyces sp. SolWspMP-sol7th]|uniref:hypothetical protein n=1 Tax=Streptomyces sp. SolWspMP-sol7th TaxID=1839776 RepID=UPI00081F0B12|nr:hypothetical protein [Streptomyces sp. SolWspMP-sol7th]SCD52620.1 hypothetical protein GA0115246_102768 [Streptomyces sp. SolWspMP-sol7th]